MFVLISDIYNCLANWIRKHCFGRVFALLLELYFLVIFPFNIVEVFIDTHCERVFDSVKIFVIVRETAIFNSHMPIFTMSSLWKDPLHSKISRKR